MNILLIRLPSKDLYQGHMPLGLAYIAGCLLENGHEVTVWDLDVEKYGKSRILEKINDNIADFQLIGITTICGDYPYLKWLTNTIKKNCRQSVIIIGGFLASALPEFLIENLPIDFVSVGEGEETIVELAATLTHGNNPENINGLVFRDDSGRVKKTPERKRLESLDDLPFPPWDHFPMDAYLKGESADDKSQGVISIMASRGCPFKCNYCDHTIKGYKVRYRSVENVIEEIRLAIKKYGPNIKKIYFWDDIFIWDRDWTLKFCNLFKRENFSLKWSCNCHVKKVDKELMARMKDAGCENVRFGIESGSQKILDSLNKGVKVNDALNALKICIDEGLYIVIYLMTGMTGESKETVEETVEFFKKLVTPLNYKQFININFFMLTPFPGTKIFDRLREEGIIRDLDDYLERNCDAHYDIPLNISGNPDDVLLSLKKEQETGIMEILRKSKTQFQIILADMTGALKYDT